MDDWTAKVDAIAEATMKEDVRILAGVPSWMALVCQRVLEKSGESNLLDVWPNLWLYMHGGVGFAPYRRTFESMLPPRKGDRRIHYLETYNASEGFFAFQDDLERDDMALLMDHGVYYEFVPMSELNNPQPETLEFREVQVGETYALVVSTNAGVWRLMVGDLVTVTSKIPLRVQVAGRVTSHLNVVGEELMAQNADRAWAEVAQALGTEVYNFTGAPRFDQAGKPVGHRWVVEFQPGLAVPSTDRLGAELDRWLKAFNGDYQAKRTADLILAAPQVEVVPEGSFDRWLAEHGRLGGQHKVPRLDASGSILEGVLACTEASQE